MGRGGFFVSYESVRNAVMVRESGSWPDEKAVWYCKIDVIAWAGEWGRGDSSKLGMAIALKRSRLALPEILFGREQA